MFSPDVRSYEIDLKKKECDRWLEVLHNELPLARQLAGSIIGMVATKVPQQFHQIGKEAVEAVYGDLPHFHPLEMKTWGAWLSMSHGEVLLFNMLYELSHVANRLGIGCTTGVVPTSRGQVHVRTLDWAMHEIGPATRIFRFKQLDREFVTVGFPGFLGVLSGMLLGKKGYSVTINGAPVAEMPQLCMTAPMLVRWVLENCDSYRDAVEQLATQPISSSVFFTVCDGDSDESCVIERVQARAAVQERYDHSLVVTNHFHDRNFEKYNDRNTLDDSENRLQRMSGLLNQFSEKFSQDLDSIFPCLDQFTVPDTVQKMGFCPRTGEFRVLKRTTS